MIPPFGDTDPYVEQCQKTQVVLVRAIESYFAEHKCSELPPLNLLFKEVPACWAQPLLPTGSSFSLRFTRRNGDFWLQSFCAYHHTSVERLSEDRTLRPDWADDIPWIHWDGNPPPPSEK